MLDDVPISIKDGSQFGFGKFKRQTYNLPGSATLFPFFFCGACLCMFRSCAFLRRSSQDVLDSEFGVQCFG
jgi:hypothetical protein